MGAPNFASLENASCYYVIDSSDDYILEDVINSVAYEIAEAARRNGWKWWDFEETIDYNRSYGAISFGSLVATLNFLGVEVDVEVKPYYRSGYYEGCNLDYTVTISTDNYDSDDLADVVELIEDELFGTDDDYLLPELKKRENGIKEKVYETYKKMSEAVEAAFAKYTDNYRLVAVASNGEAFYEQCKGAA